MGAGIGTNERQILKINRRVKRQYQVPDPQIIDSPRHKLPKQKEFF